MTNFPNREDAYEMEISERTQNARENTVLSLLKDF